MRRGYPAESQSLRVRGMWVVPDGPTSQQLGELGGHVSIPPACLFSSAGEGELLLAFPTIPFASFLSKYVLRKVADHF